MYAIEQLLRASQLELGQILAETKVQPQGDPNARRDTIAQALGLKPNQLVCGVGFNSCISEYLTAIHYLGFNSYEALAAERNYQLIHDRYTALSVDNILQIYSVLGSDDSQRSAWSDLIMTRLTTIEGQLEETINPILIGSYKLEIRGIYENALASEEFLKIRLAREYGVLRDIANECDVMLETGTCSPGRILAEPGLSIDEKIRLVRRDAISVDELNEFIESSGGEDAANLAAALASEPAR